MACQAADRLAERAPEKKWLVPRRTPDLPRLRHPAVERGSPRPAARPSGPNEVALHAGALHPVPHGNPPAGGALPASPALSLGLRRRQADARPAIKRRAAASDEDDTRALQCSLHRIDAGLPGVTAEFEPLHGSDAHLRLASEIIGRPAEQSARGAAYLRRKISHAMRIVSKGA